MRFMSYKDAQMRKQEHKQEYKYAKWLIPESNSAKQVWDFYCLILILYVCVVMPFRLAFDLKDNTSLKTIEYLIDGSFLVDIILQFFSSYFDENELVMVETHREIATRYLKTWFVFDIISIFPFEAVMKGTSLSKASTTVRIARISKIGKMTRFVRIVKFMNVFRRAKKTLKDQVKINSSLLRMMTFFGACLICVHLFSCIWIGFAAADSRNWLTAKISSLIDDGESLSLEKSEDVYRKYVLSAYFCL